MASKGREKSKQKEKEQEKEEKQEQQEEQQDEDVGPHPIAKLEVRITFQGSDLYRAMELMPKI
jgi:hypothetical protein